jgi:hypothetical protein
MDQQNNKQIIFVAVLGVVLVVVLAYQFGLFGGATPPPEGGAVPAGATAGAGAPFPGAPAKAADGQPVTLAHTDVDVKVLLASLKQEPIIYKDVRIQRNPMQPLVGGSVTGGKNDKGGFVDPNAPPEPPVGPGDTPPPPDAKQQRIISAQGHRITAIVWDARAPVAVVDDEIVSVGYTYPDGVQVHAIEPSRVVFKVDESLITVEMKEK